MTQLAKAQLNQVQSLKKVHSMERVNIMVNKKRTNGPQMKTRVEKYMQGDGGFVQDNSYRLIDQIWSQQLCFVIFEPSNWRSTHSPLQIMLFK